MPDRPRAATADDPGCASVGYGLWMLLAGAGATARFSWQGDGWVVPLTGSMTVLGALLLLEAERAGKVPADESPLVEVSPGVLTESDPSLSRRWAMPTWLHQILQMVLAVVGMFGGAIVGACTYWMIMTTVARVVGPRPARGGGDQGLFGFCCTFVVAAPCFWGGGILGLGHVQRLFGRYVPARCRECGGGSYCKLGKPITYRCRACGHVHRTIWNVK